MTTNQVLKEFKIKQDSIPEEDLPLEFIRELQKNTVSGWNLSTKEEPEEAPEEPKKLKKLTKKVKNEKVAPLVPFKTKAEARSAYLKKRITREEYKEYSKVLE